MIESFQFVNTLSAADGGPARHSLELNLALNQVGFPAQLVSIQKSSDSLLPFYKTHQGFPPPGPLDGLFKLTRLRYMRRILKAKTWIIHGYYLPWIPPLAIVGLAMRKRLAVMPHGSLTQYDSGKSRLKKRIYQTFVGRWLNRRVRFIVATTREAEDLAVALPGCRAQVVGAGASMRANLLTADTPSPSLDGPIKLLSMSRIAPKKRLDRAIEALAEMRARGIDARLCVAGSGDPALISELKILAKQLGVAEQTRFVGHVEGSDKIETYLRSHIFLLLSEDENFGIGLADALSMGLPSVVTPAVSASADLEAGPVVVVDKITPQAVADAVDGLLSDYEKHKEQARRVAEQRFSWTAVASRWVSAIHSDGARP